VGLYTQPPAGSTVICGDEKGPVAAKLYPPRGQWAEATHRPHYPPDYGRRGSLWLFGALNPHTGEGLLHDGQHRDSVTFIQFMEKVDQWLPSGEVAVVIDNLSIHHSVQTLLWNFGHSRFYFHFLPTSAAWLNLIEGWWSILSRKALDGHNFASASEVSASYMTTLARWNEAPTPCQWDPRGPKGHRGRGCIRCRRLHRHHSKNHANQIRL
jgi:hypothetical protein